MGCYFYASHCVFIFSVTSIFIREQEKVRNLEKLCFLQPCPYKRVNTYPFYTPNISMDILHTVLYTFLKVLLRRIC